MIPAAFRYARASSVEEALELVAARGEDAKVIAGGQSLLPLMKLRLARPEWLIDVGRLDELRGVRPLADGRLAIGALTTYAQLLADPIVPTLALFADALPRIGGVQVRNRGTIGGAVAHADPAADVPALLLALDAELACRSAARGERAISIHDFLQGPFTTALAPDELLTEIRLPAPSGSYGSAYRSVRQQASGFAIAGVAAVVGPDVRLAVTGVGDVPYRASAAEAALEDAGLSDDAIATAAALIVDGVTVQGDLHADAPYRASMAGVLARRALVDARERLG